MKSLKKVILIFILIITVTGCSQNKSEEVTQLLLQILTNEESHLRISAAYALGEMKSKKAVTPLIKAYKKEKDENTRLPAEAITALGKIYSKVK